MKPAGEGPFPAVVVMHGGPGISPPHCYRGAQELLVGWGYGALVVDSFSAGFSEQGRDHQPTMDDRTQDAWAAARYLASRSDVEAHRIGVVGWSLGGLATLLAVAGNVSSDRDAAQNFAAAIAIGPECPGKLRGLRTPLLILHGEADQSNAVEDCKNMRVVGGDSSALELVTYPGARHTFDFPGSPDYHAVAAEDSSRRMQAFFQRYLQRR